MDLLEVVREELSTVSLPLALAGAGQARTEVRNAVAQLDDYILPRYRSLDAPLLAVVGGSTGAGKSTLVNALVGHPVTRSGAIRPTTRQPILLHHPADAGWFEGQRVLPTPEPDPGHGFRGTRPGQPGRRNTGRGGHFLTRPCGGSGGPAGHRIAGRPRRRFHL